MLIALWIVVGLLVVTVVFTARLTVRPGRTRVWSTPEALGMAYEDVAFAARDGTQLVGWFIPAPATVPRPAPVVLSLHGWPWCRMGTPAKSLLNDLPGSRPVNLLPFFKRLHDEGYAVLAPDLRNFGDSESRGVVTGGWLESHDALGALDYLESRPDVDMDRVAAVGWSQGGATLMFTAPQTDRIKAAVSVQPTTPAVFGEHYAAALMGPLAAIVRPLSEVLYRLAGGPAIRTLQPRLAAAGARFPILYIQGTGDRWGTQADVESMAANTPGSSAIYPTTSHRFEGYTWVLDHPDVTVDFFRTHIGSVATAPAATPSSARQPIRFSSPRGHV